MWRFKSCGCISLPHTHREVRGKRCVQNIVVGVVLFLHFSLSLSQYTGRFTMRCHEELVHGEESYHVFLVYCRFLFHSSVGCNLSSHPTSPFGAAWFLSASSSVTSSVSKSLSGTITVATLAMLSPPLKSLPGRTWVPWGFSQLIDFLWSQKPVAVILVPISSLHAHTYSKDINYSTTTTTILVMIIMKILTIIKYHITIIKIFTIIIITIIYTTFTIIS